MRNSRANRARHQQPAGAAAGSSPGDGGEGARLAGLWADQAPAASWSHDVERDAGRDCPECGGPLRWAGAHTVQLCPARHADGKAHVMPSPGAVERETAHAATCEHARRAGESHASGPGATDSDSAETFADAFAYRHDMRDALDLLDRVPHLTKHSRGLVAWFRAEVAKTEGMTSEAALVRLDQLAGRLDGQELARDGLWRRAVIAGDVIRSGWALDVGDQDDDDYPEPDDQADALDVGEPFALTSGGERRPAHLPELVDYWARYDADQAAQAQAAALARVRAPAYTPPDPNWRAKATPAALTYWDAMTGTPAHPAIVRAIQERGGR
jgi:hypothetical protein